MANKNLTQFKIGPLFPMDNLVGENLIVYNNHIAVLSSAQAIIVKGTSLYKVSLPYVSVRQAQWAEDGKQLFIDMGCVKFIGEKVNADLVFISLIEPLEFEKDEFNIDSTAWSRNGEHVAILLKKIDINGEQERRTKIIVYNLTLGEQVAEKIIGYASDIRIINNHLVIISPEISIWTLNGVVIVNLPSTVSAPFNMAISAREDYFAVIDSNWNIRIIDTQTWEVAANWEGDFRDVTITDKGLIALDLDGNLHAACISNGNLIYIGKIDLNLTASHIAHTNDCRLIIMGGGLVSVHSVDYTLKCPKRL